MLYGDSVIKCHVYSFDEWLTNLPVCYFGALHKIKGLRQIIDAIFTKNL
jgi:hypothetical protein